MRAPRLSLAIALFALLLPLATTSATAGAPTIPWPGGARTDLVVPDSVWQRALAHVHRADRALGYTDDEMANFGRDALILRPVKNLFRDARAIPRFSGKVAEDLVANAADPADEVQRAFGLTDVSAGRMLPLPDSTTWGADWCPKGTTSVEALDAMLSYSSNGLVGHVSKIDRSAWLRLPASAQRLVMRIFVGAVEATPWIRAAYDAPAFARGLGRAPSVPLASPGPPSSSKAPHRPTRRGSPAAMGTAAGTARDHFADMDTAAVTARYHFAMAPFTESRMDQSATLTRASLEALSQLDREYLEFGSVVFLTHLRRALREFEASAIRDSSTVGDSLRAFPSCRFDTALGPIRLYGTGRDEIKEPAFLSLDLGGDDHYFGRHGVPLSPDLPIGLVCDLGGNDDYDGGKQPVSLGCGLFGLGAIIDRSGNDHYRCAEAGLGAGFYGVGLLYDESGDDTYVLDTHDGEGSAVAGVGLLIDRAGDDSYTCGFSAQGFGETLGAGVLVDVKGNDTYLARDDGNREAIYLNQSVSMAQGVGQGRRADLGDGHSLAGGIGFLADGAGDDSYHATAWSQGAGYWWSAGFLEDLGGNDQYRNGKYSLGAGAHFAIGCQVDAAGDDRYNIGNDSAVNQYQGHARDGSIGISIDGDGNDQYYLRNNCGGSGDLNALGFFWDRRGDDLYRLRYELLGPANGWSDTPPLGTATVYTPFRSFRDDLDAIGLFLDTGGADTYAWSDSVVAPAGAGSTSGSTTGNAAAAAPGTAPASPVGAPVHPANNSEWSSSRSLNSWGERLDVEVYEPEKK